MSPLHSMDNQCAFQMSPQFDCPSHILPLQKDLSHTGATSPPADPKCAGALKCWTRTMNVADVAILLFWSSMTYF